MGTGEAATTTDRWRAHRSALHFDSEHRSHLARNGHSKAIRQHLRGFVVPHPREVQMNPMSDWLAITAGKLNLKLVMSRWQPVRGCRRGLKGGRAGERG